MSFRTVIIKNRAKLEFRLNYLVVRGEQERKIYLSEVSTLIVQSTAVSMTASLLSEFIRNHVKVIFCDEKCSPMAELLPYYDAHNTSKRYKEQFCWDVETKAILMNAQSLLPKICAKLLKMEQKNDILYVVSIITE